MKFQPKARSRSRSRGRSRSRTRTGSSISTSVGLFRPKQDFQQIESMGPMQGFPGRNRRGQRTKSLGYALPDILTAYVDPWAAAAQGVKYSDQTRALTGAYRGALEQSMQTSGVAGTYTDVNMVGVVPQGGTALFMVTPDPSLAFINGVCGTNPVGLYAGVPGVFHWPNGVVYTGAPHSLNAFGPSSGIINIDNVIPNLSTLRQLYSAARLCAGALKLTSNMNFASVSGTIHLATVFVSLTRETSTGTSSNPTTNELQNGWQTALPTNLSDMLALPSYKHYSLSSLEEDEIVGVFPRYGVEAELFKPTSTAWGIDDNSLGALSSRYGDSDNPNGVGHMYICVFIDGVTTTAGGPAPPLTPLVEMEIIYHYETLPNASSALFGTGSHAFIGSGTSMCRPSPPWQPLLCAAYSNIAAQVPPIRNVDAAGVDEAKFMEDVSSVWSSAKSVASSVTSAVSVATSLLGALAL